jgi:fibronectin type 3 domain-containing protein
LLASDVTGTSYTDSTTANASTYYYTIDAVNGVGTSAASSEASTNTPSSPSAPTIGTATGGAGQVVVTWTAGSDGGASITGYDILRGTTSGGETLLASDVTGTSYADSTAVDGTAYFYEVEAVNGAGTSSPSGEVSATPSTVPGAPTSLSATPANNDVSLSWTAPPSDGGSAITGYDVLRGTTSGGETTLATGVSGTSYDDSTATNGTPYFYEVEATNADGSSTVSGEVQATPSTLPGAPTGLTATVSDGVVNLSWSAPTDDGGSSITGYDVLRGENSGTTTPFTTLPVQLSFDDSSVSAGNTYEYEVASVNSNGASPASDVSIADTSAPGQVTVLDAAATGSGEGVDLSWTSPSNDGGLSLTGYSVTVNNLTSGSSASETTSAMSTSFTDLIAGDAYDFTVMAVNADGNSTAVQSNTIEPVSTAPQNVESGSSASSTSVATAGATVAGQPSIAGNATGAGSIIVASYSSNPIPELQPASGSAFYDVSTTPGSSFSSVTFTICDVPAGGEVSWWDPIGQDLVTPSEVSAPTDGCVTVTVNSSTTPSLAQLYGSVFVVSGPTGTTPVTVLAPSLLVSTSGAKVFSGLVTYAAKVTDSAGAVTGGEVAFTDGVYDICSSAVANGDASCKSRLAPRAGSTVLVATYSGSSGVGTGLSASGLRIGRDKAAVSVTLTASSTKKSSRVTITVKAARPGSGLPRGRVLIAIGKNRYARDLKNGRVTFVLPGRVSTLTFLKYVSGKDFRPLTAKKKASLIHVTAERS